MHRWPVHIPLPDDSQIQVAIHGKDLRLTRLQPTSLEYCVGDDEGRRLVAIGENADLACFVPSLGERSMLAFPRPKLLCPAGLEIRVVMPLPVQVRVGVGTSEDIRYIEDIAPQHVTRALYGPVDSGLVCTSVRAPSATSIATLREAMVPIDGPDADNERGRRAFVPPGVFHYGTAIPHDEPAGDDPQLTDPAPVEPDPIHNELVAFLWVRIHNATEGPLEVSKILVPVTNLHLYQSQHHLLTNEMRMRLISKQEAELTIGSCPDPDAVSVESAHGRYAMPDRRPQIFNYTYRNKTGLEYGF